MKKTCLFFLLLPLASAFSCSTDELEPEVLSGTYTGRFSRISPIVEYIPSTVTLTFTGNKFSGSSSDEKYPAICRGTYTVDGSEIEFENGCVWTADFDWTYILDGEFELVVEGDELIITRRYNEELYDVYTLVKEE